MLRLSPGLRAARVDRLRRAVRSGPLPRHLGVVMDGNRRWARAAGLDPRAGHRAGAEHVEDVLRWCEDVGIDHLTVYVLSADNIRRRGDAEIDHLMTLLETVVPQKVLSRGGHWRLHVAGDTTLLPATTRAALDHAVAATEAGTGHLTLAIGPTSSTPCGRPSWTSRRRARHRTSTRSPGGCPAARSRTSTW